MPSRMHRETLMKIIATLIDMAFHAKHKNDRRTPTLAVVAMTVGATDVRSSPLSGRKHPAKACGAIKRSLLPTALLSLLMFVNINPALAMSNGCSAINALSGSSSLSYGSNRYRASEFATGDSLTLRFTDSGAGKGLPPTNTDSLSIARYDLSNAQTYNATNSTSNTTNNVAITVPAGSLETYGASIRASTSRGQISNLVFTCTSRSAASTDATLSGLSLSTGNLSPAFSSGTTNYSSVVGNATTSLTVMPTAADSGSTINVNGSLVASGNTSGPINLAVGSNSLTIIVRAADGQTTKSYSITVTRAEAAPIANNVAATVVANSSSNTVALSISGSASSVAVSGLPTHGTATASGTSITYTPSAGYSGNDSFTYTATNSSGTSAPATVTVSVTPPTLALAPATLPGATAGTAYSQALSTSGGTAPYNYALTAGALPAGLTLSSTGTLSGTATVSGTFNLTVTATDAQNFTTARAYGLTVAAPAPVAGAVSMTVAANSPANAVTLNLSGGTATSIAIGTPPNHGVLAGSGTAITYTPAANYSGSDSFTYTATNASGTSAPATVTITVTAPTLTLSPTTLLGATAGTAYSQALATMGGAAPYSYSVTAGALPAGVSLSSTGTLSGTPTTAGTFNVTVTATDAQNFTATRAFTLTVAVQAPVAGAVSMTVAANSTANAVTLALSGGAATSVAVATPPSHGTATASGTGISYTPTAGYSGSDSFTYAATNASGTSAPATVTVTVSAPTLTLAPATLPSGTAGTAYSQALSTSGGTAPYNYAVTAGALPNGLTLSSTGTLSGTPATSGAFNFTITATDAQNFTVTRAYTITVAVQPPVAGAVSTTVAANSTANAVTLALSGGAATSVAVATAPAHGTATVSGTGISYTPAAGYSGSDSFTYTATNTSGTSAAATVTVTVTAPTLVVSPASGPLPTATVGTAYSATLTSTGGTAPYSYSATGLPAGVTLAANGTLSGTPTTAGSYTVTVTVTDAHGATGTATYT
ncbi:beta strand repeat-containing protein, partial [Sphingomonas yabuuchiae]|uniref:beta strand repeat-containing protein n=1 Tax=Sphingomonas yabuuchiae TaxID=172044 RepID=UPI0031F6A63D